MFPNSTEEELKQMAEAPNYYRAYHAVFEIRRLLHEWSFAAATEEYAGESAKRMRERFTRALDFDFTTIRWKEQATSEAE
jgi:hypothetical protein